MSGCRACASIELTRVLELGPVPAADFFPPAAQPVSPLEAAHPAAMALCGRCGLAQLVDDDTVTQEPRGIEPQALIDQAAAAVADAAAAGFLRGRTVTEFGSPHGGTWMPHLVEWGFDEVIHDHPGGADVVIDSLGIMHEADQAAAFARRAAVTAPDGVLLLQFHSLHTIVTQGQWNALRHGHFAYYSLPALRRLLRAVGMGVATAWSYDLYGGTIMVAAVHGDIEPDDRVAAVLEREAAMTDPATVRTLQSAVDGHVGDLRAWLQAQRAVGARVYGYGASSRVVALLSLAGVDSSLLTAVADASPNKQGRRMPGCDIPIISPEELVTADPDRVVLTVPDLLGEVSRRYPALGGRWVLDGPRTYGPQTADSERAPA
ncbi:transferase [Gordonia polyisoprenivorans]|uniref:transferase n=1 Tax=Gordonia polyisoprenivorans TaxID=84595 RepID=UPI000B99EC24|nr:transferase [Gordonia polyisoprenivorans]OZC29166.1 transferase [Gordonia polyisoprenivorans]UZF57563.1 transferase [Gordonia polyisoprenivorans]